MYKVEDGCDNPKFEYCEIIDSKEKAHSFIYKMHKKEIGFTDTIPPRPKCNFSGLWCKITNLLTGEIKETKKYNYIAKHHIISKY